MPSAYLGVKHLLSKRAYFTCHALCFRDATGDGVDLQQDRPIPRRAAQGRRAHPFEATDGPNRARQPREIQVTVFHMFIHSLCVGI